jgi:hypothetical protein
MNPPSSGPTAAAIAAEALTSAYAFAAPSSVADEDRMAAAGATLEAPTIAQKKMTGQASYDAMPAP